MNFAERVKIKQAMILEEESKKRENILNRTKEDVLEDMCKLVYDEFKEAILSNLGAMKIEGKVKGCWDFYQNYFIVDKYFGEGVLEKNTIFYRMEFHSENYDHPDEWRIFPELYNTSFKMGVFWCTSKITLLPGGEKILDLLRQFAFADGISVSFRPVVYSARGEEQVLTQFNKKEIIDSKKYIPSISGQGKIRIYYEI